MKGAAVPEHYEIRIAGRLDPRCSKRFVGLRLTQLEGDAISLCGPIRDQAALHDLLAVVSSLNLTLVSVRRGGPSTRCSE